MGNCTWNVILRLCVMLCQQSVTPKIPCYLLKLLPAVPSTTLITRLRGSEPQLRQLEPQQGWWGGSGEGHGQLSCGPSLTMSSLWSPNLITSGRPAGVRGHLGRRGKGKAKGSLDTEEREADEGTMSFLGVENVPWGECAQGSEQSSTWAGDKGRRRGQGGWHL